MDLDKIRFIFEEQVRSYETLGLNIVESLEILLQENGIKYLSISYRIKETDSFMEKIDRKSYTDPLNEIEDICGIRIICYYKKDIENISNIIKNEFKIHESFDKEDTLNFDQFGYRSYHIISSINPEWEKVPNYHGLINLKCEIQIRTVLMHAWAEIEHNLAYKNEKQAPTQFRRRLHRISAKLEEADEQFEDLKSESEKYQKQLQEEVRKDEFKFDSSAELNLDTLQAFLDAYFPKRKKSIELTSRLLDQLIEYNVSLQEIKESYDKVKPDILKIEKEYFKNRKFSKWVQVGIVRFILDITNDNFAKRLKTTKLFQERKRFKEKYIA